MQYKHYQALEAGRKPDFRISTLEKLAKGLGIEPWELLLPVNLTPAVAEAKTKYIHTRKRRAKK